MPLCVIRPPPICNQPDIELDGSVLVGVPSRSTSLEKSKEIMRALFFFLIASSNVCQLRFCPLIVHRQLPGKWVLISPTRSFECIHARRHAIQHPLHSPTQKHSTYLLTCCQSWQKSCLVNNTLGRSNTYIWPASAKSYTKVNTGYWYNFAEDSLKRTTNNIQSNSNNNTHCPHFQDQWCFLRYPSCGY